MKTKPKVGDTLYTHDDSWNPDKNKERPLVPVKVMKVGRLYFYTAITHYERSEHMWDRHSFTSFESKFSGLYAGQWERDDEVEKRTLIEYMNNVFSRYNNTEIPLETLRKIKALLP